MSGNDSHWIEGWLGPRADVVTEVEKKIVPACAGNLTRVIHSTPLSQYWQSYHTSRYLLSFPHEDIASPTPRGRQAAL